MSPFVEFVRIARSAKPKAKTSDSLATAKAIAETENALRRLAAERVSASHKITSVFARRRAALLIDATLEEVERIQAEATRAELTLEKLELIEAELLARLDALKSDARRERWAEIRAKHRVAFADYLAVCRVILANAAALDAISQEAIAAGFGTEIQHAFSMVPTPHLIATDVLMRLEREHDRLGEMVIDPVRPKPPAASQAKPRPQAWAPGDAPQPDLGKKVAVPMGGPVKPPSTAPQAAPAPKPAKMESPPAPPRAAIREPAPVDDSAIALVVVRAGVEHPVTGERLRPNDRITLDRDAGLALMRGGAADLAPAEMEDATNAD